MSSASDEVRVTVQLTFGMSARADRLASEAELERRLRALLDFGTPGQTIAEKLCDSDGMTVGAVRISRSDREDG